MKPKQPEWILLAIDRIERAVGVDSLGSEYDSLIFGNEEWKEKLLVKIAQFMFPEVRFKELENGISGKQLGAIVGHYYFVLKMVGPISATVEKRCAGFLDRVRTLERAKARVIEEATPLNQAAILPVVSAVIRFGRILLKAPILLRRINAVVPAVENTIHTILGEAQVRGDAESIDFLASFQKARRMRTLDSDGRILCRKTESQLTCDISVRLLLLRDLIRPLFKNAAQLHLEMVKTLLPSQLTSNEDDENWEKEKRTVKWACDSIGLKLAAPGRTPKCK